MLVIEIIFSSISSAQNGYVRHIHPEYRNECALFESLRRVATPAGDAYCHMGLYRRFLVSLRPLPQARQIRRSPPPFRLMRDGFAQGLHAVRRFVNFTGYGQQRSYLGSAEKADLVFNGRLLILTSHVRPR